MFGKPIEYSLPEVFSLPGWAWCWSSFIFWGTSLWLKTQLDQPYYYTHGFSGPSKLSKLLVARPLRLFVGITSGGKASWNISKLRSKIYNSVLFWDEIWWKMYLVEMYLVEIDVGFFDQFASLILYGFMYRKYEMHLSFIQSSFPLMPLFLLSSLFLSPSLYLRYTVWSSGWGTTILQPWNPPWWLPMIVTSWP